VGWWPFNGNANDESGNGNNGTVNGATLTTDRNGSANSAYNFSGADYIGISSSTIPSTVINNAQLFTLSFWVYYAANNTTESYFGSWNESNGGFYINDYLGSSSAFAVLPNGQIFNTATNLTGSWHNLIYEFDGNQTGNSNRLKLFVDGVLNTLNYPYSVPSSLGSGASSLLFGARQVFGNPGEFLTGKLDDIGIWDRALTQQEITALYQAQVCSLSISSQPTNQSTSTGSNTSFNAVVTNTCSSPTNYQWQTNTGFGWQTLQNAGQYTGVNTATLNVSNVGSTNTNQLFRCIVNVGNLTDTTQTATLTVVNTNNTNLSGVTHAIPYQAVVRDGNGTPLVNHPLTVRCTLHDSNASGSIIYKETHNITTNNLGLFTLHIGTGTASMGNIDSIHWALYKKFLQVEFDTTAQGGSYVDLGTQQFMAVPYALYAETAGNALNGPKGDKGDAGVNGVDGVDGLNGSNGTNGQNGMDGISVTSATINNDSLYLSLSNSQTINAGKLSGGLPNGTAAGEMMYWNGTAWVSVAPPVNSLPGYQTKTLKYCNGVPTWNDCPANYPTLNTDSAASISGYSAILSGFVLNDGGAIVTQRGICYGTSTNPTINNNVIISGNGTGQFSITASGLLPYTKYYVRSFATNSSGTGYGNEITFTTPMVIGMDFQGGKLAYILQPGDLGFIAGELHGFIAAPSDQGIAQWGCYGVSIVGASNFEIGTGNQNTTAIINSCGESNFAAKLCADLSLNGYNDWYLPSYYEMIKLYDNRSAIGGFGGYNAVYWCSTNVSAGDAVGYIFSGFSGGGFNYAKYYSNMVRAIRSF
jgi:hypothetical protein